jgi:disulfide bond formation protein DsbB
MDQIKNKSALKLIMLFSFFAVVSTYFIQYVLGHKPCNLCFIERIPYLLSVLLIAITIILKKFEKTVLILLSLFFIFGTAISFYHFGIEQGFFSESLICSLEKNDSNLSRGDILKQLKQTTISCKDITFRFFGLSLATINTVISLILSVITIKLFLNYEKN